MLDHSIIVLVEQKKLVHTVLSKKVSDKTFIGFRGSKKQMSPSFVWKIENIYIC